MEKKITLRFHMDDDLQCCVYGKIYSRDYNRYRNIIDYICAAILCLEEDESKLPRVTLLDSERERLIAGIMKALDEQGYVKSGPGI